MSGSKHGEKFTYRSLKVTDLKTVCGWMVDEQWALNEQQVQLFYDECPSGGIVAEREDGEIIGSVFIDHNNEDVPLAWIIVNKKWRKYGVGSTLVEKVLAPVKSRNIFLGGVETSVNYYASLGIDIWDFRHAIYTGFLKKDILYLYGKTTIQTYNPEQIDDLAEYDKSICLRSRKSFLKKWTKIVNTLMATSEDGTIVGYGCVQKLTLSGDSFLVAPLFADNSIIAQDLFAKINEQVVNGAKISIYVPQNNAVMVAFTEQHQLKKTVQLTRMYSKNKIAFDFSKVFAMTNGSTAII